jgi:hypothetical protein
MLVLAGRWAEGCQMWAQHLVPEVGLSQKRKVTMTMGPKQIFCMILHVSEPLTSQQSAQKQLGCPSLVLP